MLEKKKVRHVNNLTTNYLRIGLGEILCSEESIRCVPPSSQFLWGLVS